MFTKKEANGLVDSLMLDLDSDSNIGRISKYKHMPKMPPIRTYAKKRNFY